MTGILSSGRMGWNFQIVLIVMMIFSASAGRAAGHEPLFLSEAPVQGKGRPQGFESEHTPQFMRQYRLISSGLAPDMEAFVLHPTGDISRAGIESAQGGTTISFKTPFGDGPMHGVHNLYVVDKQVIDNRLVIRIAKWHTVHHSCGWGHAYKYDSDRIRAKILDSIPLEISCNALWDRNFHSNVRSGDLLHFDVRRYGVPVPGAKIRLISGKGWTKQSVTGADGTASFQLIRDYYPTRWNEFHSRHRERFTVITEYEVPENGSFSGQEYTHIQYVSSIPWTYAPARSDYTSYLSGLFIGFFALTAGGVGVYAHRQRRRKPYQEIVFREKD